MFSLQHTSYMCSDGVDGTRIKGEAGHGILSNDASFINEEFFSVLGDLIAIKSFRNSQERRRAELT